MNNNELYHWGIRGQKWGLRKYQNPDGTLTPEGKIRYGKSHKKQLTKEAIEKKKAAILRADSPKLVYKHSNLFTTEELKEVYKRLDTRQDIANLAAKDPKNKEAQKVSLGEEFIKKANKTIAVTKKMSEMYYTFSKVFEDPGAYGQKKKNGGQKKKNGGQQKKKGGK